jgi:hypothetical protein
MGRKQRIYPLRRPLARLLPKTPTTPPIQCPPIVVTPSLKRHGPRPGTAYRIRRKHTRPVPTEKDARVGQPARPAAPSIFPIVDTPASPLFQERKKLLHEVLKAMDERWEQRVRDSAGHTWSEPRPRELAGGTSRSVPPWPSARSTAGRCPCSCPITSGKPACPARKRWRP